MTKNNTSIMKASSSGTTTIRLHNTNIVQIYTPSNGNPQVTLDSGGWLTATTKKRMNEVASEHCNGNWKVFQKDCKWFVQHLQIVDIPAGTFYIPEPGEEPLQTIEEAFGDPANLPIPTAQNQASKRWVWKTLPFKDGMTFEVPLK